MIKIFYNKYNKCQKNTDKEDKENKENKENTIIRNYSNCFDEQNDFLICIKTNEICK